MKKNEYIKKYWREEDVTFYIHFVDDFAVSQIEVYLDKTVVLTQENPIHEDSFLYDQKLSDIQLDKTDFISETEFNVIWNMIKQ